MTRRTLLQALATLGAWPFMRLRARADAVKGSFNPATDVKQVFIRLFDGDNFVCEDRIEIHSPLRRRLQIPVRAPFTPAWNREVFPPGRQELQLTTFVLQGIVYLTDSGDEQRHYEYVSGPKWWSVEPLSLSGLPAYVGVDEPLTYRPGVYLGLDRSAFK